MRLALLPLLVLAALQAEKEDPARPAARVREYRWMSTAVWHQKHEALVERARKGGIELLFLGDSITEWWYDNAVWKEHYAPLKAANFGIGGDTTQNVLWRMEHGALEGLSPKVVVLLLGVNNLGLHADTPAEAARGVTAVVEALRKKLPASKVLLLGILPWKKDPAAPVRESIREVNRTISRLDDGKSVRYLDLGAHFLAPDGSIPAELMPDFLHLSEAGYRVWAERMGPLLKDMTGP